MALLKEVSEHLFFRNIAMNRAVFDRMVSSAEEEDTKEALLTYYHLLANSDKHMNRRVLDKTIEDWMKDNFETVIDFDIDDPVGKLKETEGKTSGVETKTLLTEDDLGVLKPITLAEANEVLDYIWDNSYQYNVSVCE